MSTDSTSTTAAAGPVERGVGRLEPERDQHGARGTYGCACVDRDSVQCAAIRYGMDHYGEACSCLCHQWDDDDEY
ncbi:MAG TPA: hypothetical protein PLZ13_17925 [Ottowia sp.]|nr:hypothetical protein [Ottowia sp.]